MASSTFDSSSLYIVPSGIKAGTIFPIKPLGTANLDFARNSNATRVNSAGLIEKVRTNLILYSEQFDNADWTKNNATITANATAAPNGAITADKLIMGIGIVPTTPTTDGVLKLSLSLVAGTYTYSIFAKSAEFTGLRVRENAVVGSFLEFDLSTGIAPAGSAQFINPTMLNAGNGWYRCSWTSPSNMDDGYKYSMRVSGTGDGTSGIFIWGAQLETGDIATPYIPTTTAAVSVGITADIPRLDYTGGGCPSLLLEPQRTNLITFSEQFDNAAWSTEDLSVTANNAVSPDGFINADLLVPNTNNTDHTIYQIATAAVSQTFSVFAKAEGYNFIFLGANNGVASDGVFFNLTNGTISQNTSVFTAKIESYGNGWYRCSISAASWPLIYAIICTSANGTSFIHAGNGTSGVYAWGAQLEAGSYVSSYIPTLGSSVTRLADAASKTGISSLIGQAEGTLYVEGSIIGKDSVKSSLFAALEKTSTGATMRIQHSASLNIIYADVFNGTTFSAQLNGPAIAVNQTFKAALAYKENDFAFAVNGVIVATDNSGVVPTTDDFKINTSQYANLDAGVNSKATAIYTTRLSNAELATLTSL